MNIVNALRDLGKVGKGASNAHFFLCDDNKEYLVKFVDSGQTKTAVNELVAGTLASNLNLPTPKITLVELSPEIIQLSDDLRQRNIVAGTHIGFEKLSQDVLDFDYLNDDMLLDKTLINNDELYGVVNFDNWILNVDRNNQGNNMIEFLPQNKIKYIMIDFGHCFTGNNWNNDLQNAMGRTDLMGIFHFIQRRLVNMNGFEKWFADIENFPNGEIDALVSSIPRTWNLSSSEMQIVRNIVIHRKDLVRNIICSNRVALNIGN